MYARKQIGISLVEMIVMLACISILSAVGLPPVIELLQQRRADATISALRADVTLARTAAIMSGQPVTICPRAQIDHCTTQLDWSRGWLVVTGDLKAPADILRIGALPADGDVSLVSNRKALRYRTDGTSAGSNQTMRVCVRGQQRGTLIISNGGRPRSERTIPPIPC